MHRLPVVVALLAATNGLAACGTALAIDEIPGDRVATMAEHQLEAMHSDLATGTMTCPRLDFAVDASVRCVRIAVLSDGRQIRVLGTVRVTSTRDGGRLHVRLDDKVSEFGVTGAQLGKDLRARSRRVLRVAPDQVTCPYLAGRAGTSVQCRVVVGRHTLVAKVRAVRVVPSQYRTVYRFSSAVFEARLNPGLPSLLREIRRGGVTP